MHQVGILQMLFDKLRFDNKLKNIPVVIYYGIIRKTGIQSIILHKKYIYIWVNLYLQSGELKIYILKTHKNLSLYFEHKSSRVENILLYQSILPFHKL